MENVIQDNHPVRMLRPNGLALPEFHLPTEYSLRPYTPGDEAHWVALHAEADIHQTVDQSHFDRSFGKDREVLASRMRFLCHQERVVGTATAWQDEMGRGQVHWVALHPTVQGKGLRKPLLAAILARLAALGHDGAWLATSSGRIPAINLYGQFGFSPWITSEQENVVWHALQPHLRPYSALQPNAFVYSS